MVASFKERVKAFRWNDDRTRNPRSALSVRGARIQRLLDGFVNDVARLSVHASLRGDPAANVIRLRFALVR